MRAAWIALVVAGCGGGNAAPDAAKSTADASKIDAPKSIDAPKAIDAPTPTVDVVNCGSSTPMATVTAIGEDSDGSYVSVPAGSAGSNSSNITVNGVVEFNLTDAADHPVGPDSGAGLTDSGLRAASGAVTCLKFTAVGTFHYECVVHGFKGTVTVTQ